jgi:hypothetical protein
MNLKQKFAKLKATEQFRKDQARYASSLGVFTLTLSGRLRSGTLEEHQKTVQFFAKRLNLQYFSRYAVMSGECTLAYYCVRQKDPKGNGHHFHMSIGGFPTLFDSFGFPALYQDSVHAIKIKLALEPLLENNNAIASALKLKRLLKSNATHAATIALALVPALKSNSISKRNIAIEPISTSASYRVTGNSGQLGWIEYSSRQLDSTDDILLETHGKYDQTKFQPKPVFQSDFFEEVDRKN